MEIGQEYEVFQNSGVGIFAPKFGVIIVKGPDTVDFLQRMTSQEVKKLAPGQGCNNALLQPNAMIISFFQLYNVGSHFLLIIEEDLSNSQTQKTFENLEKFHFSEDLEIRIVSEEYRRLSIQGPQVEARLAKTFANLPVEDHGFKLNNDRGFETLVISERDFFSGYPGYHLLVSQKNSASLHEILKAAGFSDFSNELWIKLRVESGHFKMGLDITEKNLVLEAPLRDYVSRNKGCYPGQEVVERIYTYSDVSKKLVSLRIGTGLVKDLKPGAKIFFEGKEVGSVKTIETFPWNPEAHIFAMVRKPLYGQGQALMVEEIKEPALVQILPNSFLITDEKDQL